MAPEAPKPLFFGKNTTFSCFFRSIPKFDCTQNHGQHKYINSRQCFVFRALQSFLLLWNILARVLEEQGSLAYDKVCFVQSNPKTGVFGAR